MFMFTISKTTFDQHCPSQSLNIDLLVIQREMEDLENKENKFAIEGDDDTLVDLAVQWLNTKKLIAKKIINKEDGSITLPKEEVCDPRAQVQKQEKKEDEKEPTVPAPEHVSTKLDKKDKELEEMHGSSFAKEEPSASASSSKKEEARAEKKGSSNKKPPEPKPRMYYDQDITGCEDDSMNFILERLFFPDSEWKERAGFYNKTTRDILFLHNTSTCFGTTNTVLMMTFMKKHGLNVLKSS
eukprot:s194_g27.t1